MKTKRKWRIRRTRTSDELRLSVFFNLFIKFSIFKIELLTLRTLEFGDKMSSKFHCCKSFTMVAPTRLNQESRRKKQREYRKNLIKRRGAFFYFVIKEELWS